ncbi:MAG: pitrilysin family protein, partial [Bacteroidota bacterium]
MKVNLLCYSLLLLLLPGLQAQNKIEYVEYDLDNGLHVILHEDHSTPIVAVTVSYHVGSKNEDPNRTGFAHFFEHLLFEGSKNIKRGDFDDYISKAGGTNNANTFYDRTFYYEILPSNQLELGLWLESERMLHAKVEQVGIETQRQVVKEERRQRVDNRPYGTILEEAMKRAYTVHPYRWPVIGYMEHLDAAQEEDYVNFYKNYYVPNNAVLSIAGDIDVEATKAMIDQYFKDIPRSKTPIKRPKIVEPPLAGEVRDTVYDNVQLPAVVQAYRIPAQGTPEFYAVDMLSRLLSGGESSRLYRTLVDEEQKALTLFNFPLPMEDPGVSLAFGIANMGVSAQQLEDGMNRVIEDVQNELIPEREFQKLRNQIESEFILNNGAVVQVAESLSDYYLYLGDTELINTELDRFMKVTREDIREAAKKYFNKDNRVV